MRYELTPTGITFEDGDRIEIRGGNAYIVEARKDADLAAGTYAQRDGGQLTVYPDGSCSIAYIGITDYFFADGRHLRGFGAVRPVAESSDSGDADSG